MARCRVHKYLHKPLLLRWQAFAARATNRRITSFKVLYKADAVQAYTERLIEAAVGVHTTSPALGHGRTSLDKRCNQVALVFMASVCAPAGMHVNQATVDEWMPRGFGAKIEHLVRGTLLEQGGRWPTANKRLPCDALNLALWAQASILWVGVTRLRTYLLENESADGLFSKSARPERLSKRILNPEEAREKLHRKLLDHFASSNLYRGVACRLVDECAVINLTELSVNVMLSQPADPMELTLQYTLVGRGPAAVEAAALLACLRTREPSFCRRLGPVWAGGGDDDAEEPDDDPPREDDKTLRLMTLRHYLETMSNNAQGGRDREGVRRFNDLLLQLDRTDPIPESNWKTHLDEDERDNQSVILVVVTVAGQDLLGTLTLTVIGRDEIWVADVVTSEKDPRDGTQLRRRGVLKSAFGESARAVPYALPPRPHWSLDPASFLTS